MLRCFLFPRLRDYWQRMIFQQDGAPPHYANEVRQYLGTKLLGRWMGRVGPISWTSRASYLTSCDYIL